MRLRTSAGVIVLGLGLLTLGASAAAETAWRCTARPVEQCVKRHGRLSSQNGISLTLWLVGTTRKVAVENEELPALVEKYLDMTSIDHSYIFGDFQICPLERDIPGYMRQVCVVGAEKLVVEPLDGSRPPFRLLSTWPKDVRDHTNAIPKVR